MTLRTHEAARALDSIAGLSAFSLPEAKRQKLNQHATLYTFADGSRLMIRHTAGRGDAWHPAWRGTANDIGLGPVANMPLRINARGA